MIDNFVNRVSQKGGFVIEKNSSATNKCMRVIFWFALNRVIMEWIGDEATSKRKTLT